MDEKIDESQIEVKPLDKSAKKNFMRGAMKDLITDDNDENKVLKEFFVKENITVRTEMQSFEEIGNFSKFYWLTGMKFTKDTNLKQILDTQLELRLSNKRKSRREFLEAFKKQDMNGQKQGFFQRMWGQ